MELFKRGEKDDKILLAAPGGEQGYFTFLDMLALGGKEYAALADPTDALIIMELIEGTRGAPEKYVEITNEETWDHVLAAFAEKLPELFEE